MEDLGVGNYVGVEFVGPDRRDRGVCAVVDNGCLPGIGPVFEIVGAQPGRLAVVPRDMWGHVVTPERADDPPSEWVCREL